MSQTAAKVSARPELIAPGKTKDDWTNFAKQLVLGGDVGVWAEAFDTFLLGRLRSRYLKPIANVQDKGPWEGEGFTIVSIQYALIEFLAATRLGKNYRHDNPKPPHEYKKSSKLFVDFLFQTAPFDKLFSEADAKDFYSNVRCALLHEARTKGGWIIWVNGAAPVDCKKKIVYRDSLQAVIEGYINDYGMALTADVPLQEAFLRKFNDLAT
ncbi:MAG: hypothetical protein EOQ86_05015 [Mesorhizobium sp.]|uniref:hypothetical protein n=1 Tax=Mesorhizobium sp. TaxID=1871066 RepID=UPI000FE74A31|nr:hypothetical protein [Mesorhizobium sp.]RWH82633.1 MAG: hypothetical protein EOQ85_04200 [Mesorhizobium sp.]RWH87444.1 MAG: hypothetical protein EOQ86_05015 [Mesorhizobium sp.]RWH93012.1 MAG: hypothetical protein EOQ87_00090 [Mesorhizobium sp.]RWH99119.1 MAG: hypothetical protein EOQ88_13345 [Mesorhizobium sp.]RWI02299.1 MAG: hypothetical protein EOQ90_33110 [Mesorhizobium sp.]